MRVLASPPGVVPGTFDPRGFRPQSVSAADGTPVAYSACEPIHYAVNPERAPSGGVKDLHRAIEMTAQASGLTFVFEGDTDQAYSTEREPHQPERYGDRWAPVLFDWTLGTPAGAVTTATGAARPIAVGGSSYVANDRGKVVYVTGAAAFDATAPLNSGFGGATWGQVILHEIGHVVGSGHVDARDSVMNPVLGLRPAAWGEGDRAGLSYLGVGTPCHEVPAP
jgi:hypothetical protein